MNVGFSEARSDPDFLAAEVLGLHGRIADKALQGRARGLRGRGNEDQAESDGHFREDGFHKELLWVMRFR